MKRLSLAAAFALLTTPVFAQDTLELAKQYTNMPEVQNMITAMFSPKTMGEQVALGLPPGVTLTESQQTEIGQVMSAAMNDIRPRMEELMITSTAETFSVDELQALIDFYGSEHGANIMTKMQPLMTSVMGQLGPDMQALQANVTPDIVRIMQGE
jgi:hypothetical protein